LAFKDFTELCGGTEHPWIAPPTVTDHFGSGIDGSVFGNIGQSYGSTQAKDEGEF
jgi:hypothetical protein